MAPAIPHSTRRQFVKTTSATTIGALAAHAAISHRAFAQENNTLRVGLVGIGGRGSGAAVNALSADPNTKLVAVADAFADRLEIGINNLKQNNRIAERVDVSPEHQHVGFDGYKHVIDNCDVVILTTPPHFRAIHMEYAVEKDVHMFVEKPVATDAPMTRRCLAAAEAAAAKGLNVVSGLCWRYHDPKIQTLQRVIDGELGEIRSIETVYNSSGVWDPRRTREQCDSEMEYQMRNWYYYSWISGDHIVEQAIHSIDKMGWVMLDQPPEAVWGVGGRSSRIEPRYGNIFDHFSLVYEYPNGVRGYHQCRHWKGANVYNRVRDYIHCADGICDVFSHSTRGKDRWRYDGPDNDMYQTEHDQLFQAIRTNNPINNGSYMCSSTMLAIMGRDAAYTGKKITWTQAWESDQSLAPNAYEWADAPQHPIPIPGIDQFS